MPEGHDHVHRQSHPQAGQTRPASPFPFARNIRTVTPAHVRGWLARGWADMRAAGWISYAYGAVFVALGYGIGWGLAALEMLYLLTPMIAGFLLVAPGLAVGFYDISRRFERGERPSFPGALMAWRANTFHILTGGLVAMLFMMIWVRIAALIFAVTFPYTNMSGPALLQALGTADGAVFVVVGTAVGFCFAAAAFFFGVVTLPVMLDRRADIFAGGVISAQAVARSPKAMALWAALVVVIAWIGLATAFLGLIVALPLLGHATWHAYRDIVDWSVE